MQFVLNTSFDPHFCALFDDNNDLIAQSHWAVPRHDGQQIWEFLAQHLAPNDKLNFVGGVSGPGSFSSLRTAGAVLNALAFKYQLPIHQARADAVIIDYLKQEGRESENFLLNSFSQRVFWPQKKQLQVLELPAAASLVPTPVITAWLPAAKAEHFTSAPDIAPLGPRQTLLNTLKNSSVHENFIPDYEYPPVQN